MYPLKEGMTDEAYEKLFKPVMRKVMEIYQPEAIVFQSGPAIPLQPLLLRPWLPICMRTLNLAFAQAIVCLTDSHNAGVHVQERTRWLVIDWAPSICP